MSDEYDEIENEEEKEVIILPLLIKAYMNLVKTRNTCDYLQEINLIDRLNHCIEIINSRSEIESALRITKNSTVLETIMLLDNNGNGNLTELRNQLSEGIENIIHYYENASSHCAKKNCTNCINEINQAKEETYNLLQKFEAVKLKQEREDTNNYI